MSRRSDRGAILVGIGIAIVIAAAAGVWAIVFGIVVLPIYTVLGLYAGLKFIATITFITLDRVFYPGFDAPVVVVWAFWGLVGGAAIQGCREMKTYGRKELIGISPERSTSSRRFWLWRKEIAALIGLSPVFLLVLVNLIKTLIH
jgi:hypothetical protein